MDDDDDIFSTVNEFCKDDKLDSNFENTANLNKNCFNSTSALNTLNYASDSMYSSFITEKSSSDSTSTSSASRKLTKNSAQNKSSDKSITAVGNTRKQIQNNAGPSSRSRKNQMNKQTEETNNANISTSTLPASSSSKTSTSTRTRSRKNQMNKQTEETNNTNISTSTLPASSSSEISTSTRIRSRRSQKNKQTEETNNANISTSTSPANSLPGISTNTRSRMKRKNPQTKETDTTNISTSTLSASNFPETNPLSQANMPASSLSATNQPSPANMSILQHILESAVYSKKVFGRRSRSSRARRRSTPRRQTQNTSNACSLGDNNLFVAPQIMQANQNRNSRRNYIGERAARAQVVGYVDLVSSPVVIPQNIGTIHVDSDEETVTNKNVDNSVESIDEIERTPLSVKVKWGKKIEVFPYRKYQKFADIIKHFAEIEKVNKENICLNLGDRIICENDTPESVNYEVHMFIHGRMIKDFINPAENYNIKDVNMIEVKIQCDGRRHPINMSLKKSNTFSVLYAKCEEEFQVPVSKIALSFDGELLKSTSNPEELDFEGGEVIDCKIKS